MGSSLVERLGARGRRTEDLDSCRWRDIHPKTVLVMQKTLVIFEHRKISFVKFESRDTRNCHGLIFGMTAG